MTTDNTYNGWANYATWRINLELLDGMELDDWPQDVQGLSEALQAYVVDYIDLSCEDGFAKDYALAFISDVNWYEIAGHKLAEVEA